MLNTMSHTVITNYKQIYSKQHKLTACNGDTPFPDCTLNDFVTSTAPLPEFHTHSVTSSLPYIHMQ